MSDTNAGTEFSPEDMPILQPDELQTSNAKTQAAAATTSATTTSSKESVPRTTFNYVVIAATFLIVGIVIGGLTFGSSDGGVDEQTLRRAINQAVAAAGGDGTSLVDMDLMADDDPFIGSEDAPVTIVEFSAYACPYCARHFEDTLEPLLENYGDYIRYVYRDFPVINPQVSQPAAFAANCANEQGRFWDYHEMLFSNQERLGNTFFLQAATELDLDMDAFTECIDDNRYVGEVEGDYVDGILNNISGTPAFYINGQFLSGALPYEAFERAVLRELSRLGIEPDQA